MEATPTPPSPTTVFLELQPPTACGMLMEKDSSSAHQDNDLVLPYISRLLMEDDIADKLFFQQYDLDEPALLEAQQPFIEIISNAVVVPSRPCNNNYSGQPLVAPAPYTGTAESMAETNSLLLPPETETESSCGMDAVSMAFFRGMEEANKFVPSIVVPRDRDRETVVDVDDSSRSRKKRHESEAAAEASKQMAAPESEEEATAREMLDRLMLDGYNPSLASDMNEAEEEEETMTMSRSSGRRRRSGTGTGTKHAVDMHTLLIRCAEAMSNNDWCAAAGLLERIKYHSSPTGDSTQRLAHCFAKGLEARLAGMGSQTYLSLVAKRASMVVVLKTYQLFMDSCCFLPVQLLFSNKTIYKAVAGRKKLHIVDYGLGHGIQWPDLLRWLSRREGGPPEVRFTGIDKPQPGFRPAWPVEETGRRLNACACQFGVPFQFRGVTKKKPGAIAVEDLDIDPDEVLVVNSMFHLETLMDESIVVERPNPRDVVLGTISKMRPSVFVHAIANGSHSSAFFMARFRDALQRYSALFDMMDNIAPRDDDKRVLVEQDIFARSATSIIACEGVERVVRPQNYKQWQARNQRAGLRQLPLDPEIVEALKDKVKKEYHKCFVISEDQRWLLQGWKGRVLFAISTWTADS
ncbi:scarecrow-like protein 9 [Sorghum bicolor]|uniref:Uncharacterized protein n=1 Tax=Sorghum bicolor TaxID=4558 RepID=A0A1Z5RK52_SORBI|nr:scarecrow-like protein 9 [Sorghum bicolor]OQU84120.1 hypothetical protein SORBI_3005G230900 [Sorghum bicolor]|eukprot:XP_021317866.1 scarecrow-like protein 9 [Sorghum bicolor]